MKIVRNKKILRNLKFIISLSYYISLIYYISPDLFSFWQICQILPKILYREKLKCVNNRHIRNEMIHCVIAEHDRHETDYTGRYS